MKGSLEQQTTFSPTRYLLCRPVGDAAHHWRSGGDLNACVTGRAHQSPGHSNGDFCVNMFAYNGFLCLLPQINAYIRLSNLLAPTVATGSVKPSEQVPT
jgi:hypothetical protein